MEEILLLRQLISVTSILFFSSTAQGGEIPLGVLSPCANVIFEDVVVVPLIRILAHPDPYVGKCIAINGYMSFGFEDDYIYLTDEDYEKKRKSLAVTLVRPDAVDSSLYDERYYSDHYGGVIGTVSNIRSGLIEKSVFNIYKIHIELISIDAGHDGDKDKGM